MSKSELIRISMQSGIDREIIEAMNKVGLTCQKNGTFYSIKKLKEFWDIAQESALSEKKLK